jgi:Tol biopolymer transport system component
MKYLLLLLSVLYFLNLKAQPGSEIILFDLKIKKNKVIVSNPQNVTNHPGYDNQPSFNFTEPIMYYSSFNDEGRSEIKAYNYKTSTTEFITQTHEREYSPTPTPDGKSLSCIIQRDNGAQDLGKYPIHGGESTVIIDNLIVGYHAWIDNSHLALFVLGEPNSLHYIQLPTKNDTIIANNVGRSIHKVPGERAFNFVHKLSDSDWIIKKYNTETKTISLITNTFAGKEDICLSPDGKIISSDGTNIYFFNSKSHQWNKVIMTDENIFKGVTRLAINTRGDKLAVVISE